MFCLLQRALAPKSDDSSLDVLRSLRGEKDNTFARRRRVDQEIAGINEAIRKKVSTRVSA